MAANVEEVFEVIKNEFSSSKRANCVANLPQLVLFAEKILKGNRDEAIESIQLYLSMDPPLNQFLIRAYLCLAAAYKPTSPTETTKLQDSLRYISKAVNIARKNSCYHFLVYNSSVILWRVTHPFHVPQYYSLLTSCVQNTVKALEEIQYKDDYEWRLQLVRLLIKCLMANYQKDDAIRVGQSALHMARKHAPHMLMPLFKQMVLEGIGDTKLIEKETKRSPYLLVLSKVWKLQSSMYRRSFIHSDAEAKLMRLISMVEATPPIINNLGTQPKTIVSKPLTSVDLSLVLIEIGEIAINHSLHHIAELCITRIHSSLDKDLGLLIRLELLKLQLKINKLLHGPEKDQLSLYTKHAIKVRCLCVEKCHDLLVRCVREKDYGEIERISVVLWNISLPMLQPSLSHNVTKSFSLATDLLEKTNSLMYGVRSVLHFELAKILYNQDRMDGAHEHIDKAMYLDHRDANRDHYSHLKQCLQMKSELYSDQQISTDKALGLLEQVKSCINDRDGLRQLLLSIVDCIDPPNNFSCTLNHQTIIDPSNISEQDILLHELADKSTRYNTYKERAEQYHKLSSVGSGISYSINLIILSDVARLARKHYIWDVALLTSLYCIQYDESLSTQSITPTIVYPKVSLIAAASVPKDSSNLKVSDSKSGGVNRGSSDGWSSTSLRTPDHAPLISSSLAASLPLPYSYSEINTDKLQQIALAEVHCILGECLIHALYDEGLQLGGVAVRSATVNEENQLWKIYSDWIELLSFDAHKSFIRCAELGSMLCEPWLVTNGAVYIWNYNFNNLQIRSWKGLTNPLRSLLQTLKGQSPPMRDNPLICRTAGILAGSLIQSTDAKQIDYSPVKATNETQTKKNQRTGSRNSARSKKKKEGVGGHVTVSQEYIPLLKEAIEVCEFAAGECFADTPLDIRRQVLESFVIAKQLLQQSINVKSILTEEEIWFTQCQAIIYTEMHHTMTAYGSYEFPNCLSIKEVYELINECDWKGHTLIQLELLTLLAHSAHVQHLHDEVIYCCELVLKASKPSSTDTITNKLLSICNSLYGQSLICIGGRYTKSVSIVSKAMDCFYQSISLCGEACTFDDVIQNSRHAWNALILLDTPNERAGLKDSVVNTLTSLLKHVKRNDENQAIIDEEDNKLLNSMIVSLMDIYMDNKVDKTEWNQGIEILDRLLRLAPKQYLRILYEYKILLKSKLGRNIEGDMLRFQEEPLYVIASLWYSCACVSTNQQQRFTAYQKAIACLQKEKCNDNQPHLLTEYITQFSIWLHNNQYPTDIVIKHLKWAVHKISESQAHCNISLLDKLLILHIMIFMSSSHAPDKEHYCLKSVGYCLLIWRELICTKQQPSGELPIALKEWMCFSPSNELQDLILAQNTLESGDESINTIIPSRHTLKHPILTLYYLDQLYTGLCCMGQYTLVLPILFYQQLIAQNIIKDNLLLQLTSLRLSVVLGSIVEGDNTLSHDYFNKATIKGFIYSDNVLRMSCHVTNGSGHVTSGLDHVTSDGEFAQSMWLKLVDLLIKQGQFMTAKDMLQTVSSCIVTQSLRLTHQLLSLKLSAIEGEYQYFIGTLTKLESTSINTIADWIILLEAVDHIGVIATDKTKANVKKFLHHLVSNRSCDNLGMSCDQKYLTGLIHLSLLKISDNVIDSVLELEILSNIDSLNSFGCYQLLCARLLCSIVQFKLTPATAGGDIVLTDVLLNAVEYSQRATHIIKSTIVRQGAVMDTVDSPLYKVLIGCQLVYCQSLLAVYKQYVMELKSHTATQQNKPSIIKMIDQFISSNESPLFEEQQQRLQSIQRTAADEGIALLSSILSLTSNNEQLKAECLMYLGLFLYYVSFNTSPDPPLQWTTPTPDNQEKLYSTLSLVMRNEQAEKDTVKEQYTINGLMTSSGLLMSSVARGLACKQLDIALKASLALVEIFGSCDPGLACNYLALYQSCVVSQYCGKLLRKVCADPSSSRLSSLINQESVLKSCDEHMTTSTEANQSTLHSDYQVHKRLEVSVKHLELINHIHCDTRIIILQHSHNMDKLYVGYLIPPQPPIVIKKGQPPPDKASGPIPAVGCVDVCHKELSSLKELMSQYKKDIINSIQKQEGEMLEMIQSSFNSIVASMESYLEEVLKIMVESLGKEDPSKELTIVLVMDYHLMELPIESLQFLQQFRKNIVCVSRDFSLQILAHRIISMKDTSEAGNEDDGKKKVDKYQPQPESFAVNTASVKYILDPRSDLTLGDRIKNVIQDFSKITLKWSGSSGNINSNEWANTLCSCSSAIIVCSENILSHFSPHKLASINLPNCSIALIEDQLRTNASFRIQSKLDITKSIEELQQEDSMVAVILLSLAGVNSIVINRWYSSLNEGSFSTQALIRDLLSKSLRTGQIRRNYATDDSTNDDTAGQDHYNSDTQSYKEFIKVVYGLPHLTFMQQ